MMDIFRGDIFYIMPGATNIFDLKDGRPGIIVSNNMGNKHSERVEVVFLTTREKKPMPTHVEIVCKQRSTAMCEEVYTIRKEYLGEYIQSCTAAEMQRIEEAIMISLGIVSDQPCYEAEPQRKIIKGFCAEEESSTESVTVERDLYKKLYEQLLDKITG